MDANSSDRFRILRLVATMLWLITSATLILAIDPSDAGLVLGPPKLDVQSNAEVWFHIPVTGAPTKFSLDCQASGDPEEFRWERNGEALKVDGERIIWQKPGQSGTIVFLRPARNDQGYYQCYVTNIFGTAVSNRVHVQLGVLDHFNRKELRKITVVEGESLTIPCAKPHGDPVPSVFWLYRDTKKTSVIETIRRKHITVDGDGNLQFSHVTEHDGRDNLIYQCAATSPVLQGEYRAGDEVQLIVTESQKGVQGRGAEKLWFSPENVVVKAGERLKLMCIFGGMPVPQIYWRKTDGNGELPKNRIRDLFSIESDFGKSLIIDPVLPTDEGIYECSAQGITHRMAVQVTAAPFWESKPPADINQAEETTAELRCEASGDPQPLIRWFMNGRRFDEVADNPRRIALDGGRVLRITELNHDVDTGVYQCNASNSLGYVFANAFVNVRAHAPRFNMPVKRLFKVVTKTTVEMTCEVEAAPDPVIRWVDSKDHPVRLVTGKIELDANHTLKIFDASFADDGLYYCNVTNKYGLNRATNMLEVYNPTYFTDVPKPNKRVMEANDGLELSCEAKSDERLGIDYRWMLNGEAINVSDPTYSLTKPNHLKILNARGRHSGFYDCMARTEVDERRSGMQLTVRDVPEEPVVTDVDCNERRAMVRWKQAFDNHDPLLQYVVEMETAFHKGVWRVALTEQSVDKDAYEADITLTPWVNYTFRVIAVNSHGRSSPGMKSGMICNTKPSFPYKNPTNVSAAGTDPQNLVIYWQPMDKEDWNAKDFLYVIRYRLNEQGAEWHEFRVEDPLANHTIIRDQPTFREYSVQVRAHNAIGNSIVDPINVVGYSGEDKPDLPPEGFEASEFLNATSVRFVWNHVDRSTVNGHFKGYRIQTWPVVERQKRAPASYLHNVLVDAQFNTFVLHDFEPMGVYNARILTVNQGYASDPSKEVKFTMPEGIPTEVHKMRVRAVGASTILVTWEAPLIPRGRLRGYYLTFENASSGHIEETYVVNRQFHYVHESAHPDTEYEISVWAETGGGEGPKVVQAVKTWPLRDPAKPDFLMNILSPNSAKFTWLPPNEETGEMPGSAFYLNYTEADSDNWIQTHVQNLPIKDLVLEGLEPNKQYQVYVIAKDGNRTAFSELKQFFTKDDNLGKNLSTATLSSAAWFIAIVCAVAVALVSVMIVCVCQRSQSGKYPVKKKELERGHTLDGDEDRSFMEYQYGSGFSKEPITS